MNFEWFHRIITPAIDTGASEMLLCGMALHHADPSAVENSLVTERELVFASTTFLD